jgi:hypothetical protein
LLIPVNYSRSQLPSGSLMVKVKAADESDQLFPAPPSPTVLPGSFSSKASSSSSSKTFSSPSFDSPYPALGPDNASGIAGSRDRTPRSAAGAASSATTQHIGQSSTGSRRTAPRSTNPVKAPAQSQSTPPLRGE